MASARCLGCSCTSISRLCSPPRHAGGCHERYEGTTSAGNDGWGFVLSEQSSESHQERLQRPQGAHLPGRRLACRAPREASKGGRMRAVLLSARQAKPAEAHTWPSRTLTPGGMAVSVRREHRRAPNAYRHEHAKYRLAESRFSSDILKGRVRGHANIKWRCTKRDDNRCTSNVTLPLAEPLCCTVSYRYVSDHLHLSRRSADQRVRSWRWMLSRHGARSPARRAPCRRSRTT